MHCYHRFLLLVILLLSGEKIFCQTDYESMSKKEMKALLFKKDSLIQHHENQISIYKDLTIDLNNKILLKKDSIVSYAVRIKHLISEKNNLEQEMSRLKKENTVYNNELKENNRKINVLDTDLKICKREQDFLSATADSLSKSLSRTELILDSLTKSLPVGFSLTTANSNDILNKMYFKNEFPDELHSSLEFSGVILSSLTGGVTRESGIPSQYYLDEFIEISSNGFNNEDYGFLNSGWRVFYPSEFIPKSRLEMTTLEGGQAQLKIKFDLYQGELVTLSNEYLEKNSFLCTWKISDYYGKRVVDWNLAHNEAGKMRDMFFGTYEYNGEAYIALNNFQLLRLKNGFSPYVRYLHGEQYSFEDEVGNNKILTRLKDENSQSAVLNPAYCIYLFKLVK